MNQTRPLVDAYLERLHGLLDGAPRETRAEVMAGVREHLDARLPDDASPAQVRSVLGELGTPEHIADEANVAVPDRASAPASPRLMERAWVPVIVMFVSLLWLVAPTVIVVGSSGNSALALHPIELLALLFVPPAWPVVAIMVGISRLWIQSEKVALIATLPMLAGWLLLLSPLPNVLRTVGSLLGVVTAAWVVVRAGRKGLARAR
ncbi:hypothetical protein BA895_08910 [Humibacillus sp. DSM 29435]|uniref:HAAS signaling domain-containing protein n=1 Tax=Humibacillus sp. DSM 29435 TaxID=1869167 RepID=UPI000873058B|nr:hypothetical protein [Humibacillus sp. DSM 29435]OFE14789.1 hypothetical protein BA895_08910 [Humibacillus sp. DSM 29435]